MPNITWYGPEFGEGSTGDRVSHTTPVVKKLKEKSTEIQRRAAWFLDSRARHRTGDSKVTVKHHPTTYLDSYVELEDHTNAYGAVGIEMEHHVLRDAANSI